jgi:hypothetical protein
MNPVLKGVVIEGCNAEEVCTYENVYIRNQLGFVVTGTALASFLHDYDAASHTSCKQASNSLYQAMMSSGAP